MRRASLLLACLFALLAFSAPARAQQTTGTIAGRLTDAQGAAVPGVTVTGRNVSTGFLRTGVTDGEGVYRLSALPVGTYDVTAELQGFAKIENKGIVLNVGQTLDVDMILKLAGVSEAITVNAETPIIETGSSSVGGVVDISRIESLPLNGRQFANLAATIPGVGLGFHSDPTKSSQFSPQINGGNGRNVNYQIDGGDNNDDTVGGLLQLFPLEAIQEFNFVTQRFKAEYGRSNGGVMNIITKSGTNNYHGSAFTLFRDKSLNARTFSQQIANIEKTDYKRYQFGGSFGGPIILNKAHFFGAVERTQQDTNQAVNTLGLFPGSDGVYATPYRENLITVKGTMNLNPAHYLSVRYGRNNNSQPYGATLRNAPSAWSTSKNEFNSLNLNHNWVIGGTKLNEVVFQYADFKNNIPLSSSDPWLIFPNGVRSGANPNTPQSTEQTKWQFRDDFSWSVTGMGGLGHDFKVGANWIHEPHLFATFNGGATPQLTLNSDSLNSTVRQVLYNGGAADVNIPLDLFAFYVQDDWRINDRLTLNLGLRYDYVDGVPIGQEPNENFRIMQSAGAAGRFANFPLLEDFGLSSRNDGDNWQPRAGFAYDLFGNGRDVVRGGWGLYTDFGFTNSNVLFPAIDVGRRTRPGVLREQPGRHPQGGWVLLHGGRSDFVDRLAERGRSDARAGLRAGRVATARTALHPPDQLRVVAPGRLGDGADGRLRARRRPRHQHAVPPEYPHRRRPETARGSAHPSQHAVVPDRGQQGREHLRWPDHRAPPPDVEGLRPERVVHAQRCPQHHRHRQRRARCQQHPGCDRPVQPGEHRALDAHRRAPPRVDQRRRAGAVGHPGRALLHLPDAGCRRSPSKGSISTTTAT